MPNAIASDAEAAKHSFYVLRQEALPRGWISAYKKMPRAKTRTVNKSRPHATVILDAALGNVLLLRDGADGENAYWLRRCRGRGKQLRDAGRR